jgi:hypothetical protein
MVSHSKQVLLSSDSLEPYFYLCSRISTDSFECSTWNCQLLTPDIPEPTPSMATMRERKAFVTLTHRMVDRIIPGSDLNNNEHLVKSTIAVPASQIGGDVHKLRAVMGSFFKKTIQNVAWVPTAMSAIH